MKSFLIQTIFVIAFACLISSAMAGFGPCPEASFVDDDFNATEMRGLWYLYSTSNGHYDSYRDECRTDLIMSKGNETVDLDFKVYTATMSEPSNRTERWVRTIEFEGETSPHCTIVNAGSYWPASATVMDTDHFSYAILQV